MTDNQKVEAALELISKAGMICRQLTRGNNDRYTDCSD